MGRIASQNGSGARTSTRINSPSGREDADFDGFDDDNIDWSAALALTRGEVSTRGGLLLFHDDDIQLSKEAPLESTSALVLLESVEELTSSTGEQRHDGARKKDIEKSLVKIASLAPMIVL